jgi:hypothetical protein
MSDGFRRGRFCGRPASGKADWARLRERFSWKIPETLQHRHRLLRRLGGGEARQGGGDPSRRRRARSVWTYGDLKRASDRLAAALAARGVMRGDRVAVLMSQHPAVLVSHLAAMKLGAVSVPLFTLFGSDALRYRLADSGARAVIVESAALDRVMALRPDLPDLQVVISTGVAAPPVLAFDEIVATPAPGFTPVRTDAEDAACLIYTSGTTGDPKGVLHAHRFLYGHLPCLELSLGWFPQPGDVGWTPADWAWIGGLMDMALPCLFYGVPLVSHRFAKFDPEAAMRLMAEEGVSVGLHPAHGAAPDAPCRRAEGTAPAGHRLGRGGAGRRPARLGSWRARRIDQRILRPDRMQPRGRLGRPGHGPGSGRDGPAGAGPRGRRPGAGRQAGRGGRGGRGLRPRARPGDVPRILGQSPRRRRTRSATAGSGPGTSRGSAKTDRWCSMRAMTT